MQKEIVLRSIAASFRKNGIVWAIGGSKLLQSHGMVQEADDLDLLIAWPDAEKSHELLVRLGAGKRGDADWPFCTVHFFQYDIQHVRVDVMSRYRIQHEQGRFELPFDAMSIAEIRQYGDQSVPLAALEDWYVLYLLHPAKQRKADLIEQHFRQEGLRCPDLLKRALDQELPDAVRERIRMVIEHMIPDRICHSKLDNGDIRH